jgi:hypothetical protein
MTVETQRGAAMSPTRRLPLSLASVIAVLAFAAPASAQGRTYSLEQLQSACRIHSSAYNCARAAQQARIRYGNTATIYQWNSAVGVVRNWVRQGR